jgi:hypothetical protein
MNTLIDGSGESPERARIRRRRGGNLIASNIWGLKCAKRGCKSTGGVYRPDDAPISNKRAQEIAILNGWAGYGDDYYCPDHAERAAR